MHKTWYLVAPATALKALRPLIEAHGARRPVRIFAPTDDWKQEIEDAEGVLVIGDRRHTPRTASPGPFLLSSNGRRIPVGWLPYTGQEEMERFALAAAEVQCRDGQGGPIALLGQWDDHVDRLTKRSIRILSGYTGETPVPVFRWTAERIIRRDLLVALRIGLGMVLYCGHGRSYGWAGYHGLHSRHLMYARGNPSGSILSLTCHTANRYRVSLSFAEMVPLQGIAAAAFGAVGATKTVDNLYWGVSICEVLADRPGCSLGELIAAAAPPDLETCALYRILGDPLAPLAGASEAAEACAGIWAPAPDDSPIPPGYLEGILPEVKQLS